ncbi:MAG TPA: SRPBCC family protein [Enhygromyxa sp.]|nr:SRPBCC family protein [Enhygromyxa sp.]
MKVFNTESIVVPGARAEVFERAFSLAEMPKLLRGWGPVPGVERAELLDAGGYAVGKIRRIHNTDGSSLDEEILVHEPPSAHSYRLYGDFRGLAKLLVSEGRGDWRFVALDDARTEVSWRYQFTLTSPLAWPLALPMMKVAFANMQRGTLKLLRAAFE